LPGNRNRDYGICESLIKYQRKLKDVTMNRRATSAGDESAGRPPTPAGLYDYYLGGTHSTEAEQAAGEQLRAKMPELYDAAWASRGFLQRAARWLAAEMGIRQFIDLGAGLPTAQNTHEVVQKVTPDACVVYVDNDPQVEIRARQLLAGAENVTAITGDLRDPDAVLNHPDLRASIDLGEPVALLMVAVVHFVADEEDPWGIVRHYTDVVAPGSYLALSQATADRHSQQAVDAVNDIYSHSTTHIHLRTREQVTQFFAGLELVAPGKDAEPSVTFVGQWGADDPAAADSDGSRWNYCGVARCR
jgi:O-methyltransferase involved in polyketide biosynthesis